MRLEFDLGTILILDAPSDLDVAQLPFVVWDSRVSAWRCPAFLHAHLKRALDALAIRYTDESRGVGTDSTLSFSLTLR